MATKICVWKASIFDHSGLSGPMGSEVVKRIDGRIFTSQNGALEWIYKWGEEMNPGEFSREGYSGWEGLSVAKKLKSLADRGWWGAKVSKQTVYE